MSTLLGIAAVAMVLHMIIIDAIEMWREIKRDDQDDWDD